jgi:hypothetical protein
MANRSLHECFHETTTGTDFTTKVWNGFLIGEVALGNTNEYAWQLEISNNVIVQTSCGWI